MSSASIEEPSRVTHRVPVDLAERSYEVLIGTGLLGDASAWGRSSLGASAMIVTNSTVAPLYLARLEPISEAHSAKWYAAGPSCLVWPGCQHISPW